MVEQGKSVRNPSLRRMEQQPTCNKLTTTHNACSLFFCDAGGYEVKKSGVKLGPGRSVGGREEVLRFDFISNYPKLGFQSEELKKRKHLPQDGRKASLEPRRKELHFTVEKETKRVV